MTNFDAFIKQGQAQSKNLVKGGTLLLDVDRDRSRVRFALRGVSPPESANQVFDFLVMVLSMGGQMCNLEVLQRQREPGEREGTDEDRG